MPTFDEPRLDLARSIATSLNDAFHQKAFAIIALFSGKEEDLNIANSRIPEVKVIYIKVLLFLGRKKEALEAAQGLSLSEHPVERNNAEEAIALFLISKGEIEEAKRRLVNISEQRCRANIFQAIAQRRGEELKRMADEIAELRRPKTTEP